MKYSSYGLTLSSSSSGISVRGGKNVLSFLQMSDFLPVVKHLLLFSGIEWILLHHHGHLISTAELLQMVKMILWRRQTRLMSGSSSAPLKPGDPTLWQLLRVICSTLKISNMPVQKGTKTPGQSISMILQSLYRSSCWHPVEHNDWAEVARYWLNPPS